MSDHHTAIPSAVPVDDRGLQYGDGLFETIAVKDGEPLLLNEHMQRLLGGCKRLGFPAIDQQSLVNQLRSRSHGDHRGVLRVTITRGSGGRGYAPPVTPHPRVFVTVHPWPTHVDGIRQHGAQVRLCDTRLAVGSALAGLKHLNRLEQVMARAEWSDVDIHEGLTLNHFDQLVEGTMSNVFMVVNGELVTPDLNLSGVAGIIRQQVIDHAGEWSDHVVGVRICGVDDLARCSELFLSNAIIGIWPVRRFEHRQFTPGPVTLDIAKALLETRAVA